MQIIRVIGNIQDMVVGPSQPVYTPNLVPPKVSEMSTFPPTPQGVYAHVPSAHERLSQIATASGGTISNDVLRLACPLQGGSRKDSFKLEVKDGKVTTSCFKCGEGLPEWTAHVKWVEANWLNGESLNPKPSHAATPSRKPSQQAKHVVKEESWE